MTTFLRWGLQLFQRRISSTRQFQQSAFHILNAAEKIREENLAWYKPEHFYPLRIGEVFHSRYEVLGKHGYGAYSTVWLCQDLR
ncbi:protein kinase domain protein [Lasallia pustulata]|uniref:Protein kinase domain protein n=1 Tax=Lasallia pustulata TaxID=136370 RepID=A0A1W5D3W3_9LECA|nr:protein kinase domain protein [Lasallia pustulata]